MADHNVRLITIAPSNVKTEILDQAASQIPNQFQRKLSVFSIKVENNR